MTRAGTGRAALALVTVLVVGSALADGDDVVPTGRPAGGSGPATAAPTQMPADEPPADAAPPAERPPDAEAPAGDSGDLLTATGGDGDSWRDTAGREYRLGLVNAPETDQCFGPEATERRRSLTAGGFRVRVYAQDDYGRSVSVVTLPDGTNLNVWLARHGFADDRYLERFRSENAELAAELDAAFAAARAQRVGLWGACSGTAPQGVVTAPAPAPAPPPAAAADGCHPDYLTCIPVKGDGSGRGEANDLDCGSIGVRVQLRRIGVDPYRLDREGDGFGCEGP